MFPKDQSQNGPQGPPNTLLREESIDIRGNEIVSSTETYIRNKDNSWVRRRKVSHEIAADGRWVPVKEFGAFSWTGLAIPSDSVFSCLNPFELHVLRLVYVGLDGVVTDLGNVLCQECYEIQKKRLFYKNLFLFGLIYHPEQF